MSCGAPTSGATLGASIGGATAPVQAAQGFGATVASVLGPVHRERSGAAAAAVVFAVCLIVSVVGWTPLSLPPRLVGSIVPEGNCTGEVPQTRGMYLCSVKVASLTMAGPLLVIVGLVVVRRPITAWIKEQTPKLPEEARFLIAPVLATVMFGIAWAGVHYETADLSGILPQRFFPAVVGLFTFAVTRFGPALQQRLQGFFTVRDRFPAALRIVAALLIPVGVSLLITNQERVSDTALKEQFVVLISLCTGYLALTPRSGDFASGMRDLVERRGQRA